MENTIKKRLIIQIYCWYHTLVFHSNTHGLDSKYKITHVSMNIALFIGKYCLLIDIKAEEND